LFKRVLPFVTVRVNPMPVFEEYIEMGYLMNIGDQEEKGIQVFVEGYPRTGDAFAAREVPYFGLTAPGELQFEGRASPKGKTIG
jgi:hypothetical protein